MDSTVPVSVSLKAVILSPDAAVLEAISDASSSVAVAVLQFRVVKIQGGGNFPRATSLYITNAG